MNIFQSMLMLPCSMYVWIALLIYLFPFLFFPVPSPELTPAPVPYAYAPVTSPPAPTDIPFSSSPVESPSEAPTVCLFVIYHWVLLLFFFSFLNLIASRKVGIPFISSFLQADLHTYGRLFWQNGGSILFLQSWMLCAVTMVVSIIMMFTM
jgi:hypothetical protein